MNDNHDNDDGMRRLIYVEEVSHPCASAISRGRALSTPMNPADKALALKRCDMMSKESPRDSGTSSD
jgi:hypothetical protein